MMCPDARRRPLAWQAVESDLPLSFTSAGAEGRAVSLLEQVAEAGLWTVDAASGQARWSEGMAQLLGAPMRWTSLSPGPYAASFGFVRASWRRQVHEQIGQALAWGQEMDLMVQVTARGRACWSRLRAQAVRDRQGRIQRLEGVLQLVAPAQGAALTIDAHARINHLNEEAERLLGLPLEHLAGRCLWALCQRTVQSRVEAQVRSAMSRGEAFELEETDAAQVRWLQLHAEPFAQGMVVSVRDVTRRHREQEQLCLLESCIARLNDLVIITEAAPLDEPGPRIVFVNEAFERRTGYSRQEVMGRSPRLLQGPQTQRASLDRVRHALQQWQAVRVDLLNYRKDGHPFWIDLEISPVWDHQRHLTHWVALGRDITERRAAERRIRQLAFYDALTGLPNRPLLLERLQDTLAPAGQARGGALMFIDLDNFKRLNDTMGHLRGDQLLQQVAVRLRACVTGDDTVARLGGDEFVVLLPAAGSRDDVQARAQAVSQQVLLALAEPYLLSGHVHHGTCSVGVTLFGAQDGPLSELLKQADLAMYQAKRSGRNASCFYDPQLQVAVGGRRR